MEYKLKASEHFTISKEGKSFNLDENVTKILYSDLVIARNNGKLIPGRYYRITDYITTTSQSDTKSAGHLFDIIVLALEPDVLSESACSCLRESDTYFSGAGSKLNAWGLKYCLDNDSNRFAWALPEVALEFVLNGTTYQREIRFDKIDEGTGQALYAWGRAINEGPTPEGYWTLSPYLVDGMPLYSHVGGVLTQVATLETAPETGKGVIYYMKDEWGNECPYDFKNIMFQPGANVTAGTVADVFYYTFSVATGTNDSEVTDHSLNGAYCFNNRIGPATTQGLQTLNSNVFRNTSNSTFCDSNTLERGCSGNTFGTDCQYNKLDKCSNNDFGEGCSYNKLGDGCNDNTFGTSCSNNTFGSDCTRNTFAYSCSYNTFGSNCFANIFDSNCTFNTFGNSFAHNFLGMYCNHNTFGIFCLDNTLNYYCSYNTFGSSCSSNTLGSSCSSNEFGVACSNITFAKGYTSGVIVEANCRYITLTSSSTTSSSSQLRNITIAQGVNNSTTPITISHDTVADTFQTIYKKTDSQIIEI